MIWVEDAAALSSAGARRHPAARAYCAAGGGQPSGGGCAVGRELTTSADVICPNLDELCESALRGKLCSSYWPPLQRRVLQGGLGGALRREALEVAAP